MEKKKKYKDIELRSEEVQEIMSQIPSWIVRWGITVLFIVVVILLVGSYFFKYPDVLNAEITVTTAEPPANIVARNTGKLDALFVKNRMKVNKGVPLAVVQNPANTQDILALKHTFVKWKQSQYDIEKAKELFANNLLKLGAVQSAYSAFLRSLRDYENYRNLNYYSKKIETQKRKLAKQEEYYERVARQEGMVSGKSVLASSSFERDSILYAKDIISKNDYEQSRSNYLQNRRSYLSYDASLKQIELQLIQGRENLLDLKQKAFEAEQKYRFALRTNIEGLLVQLEAWEQQYLLVAPVEGIVSQMKVWSQNQNVNAGDVVFTITPVRNTKPKGTALLPVQGAGKVKIGQRVNVRINNFPDQEFGYLEGIVISISRVPTKEGFYVLAIDFPQGLQTNYQIELPQTGEMRGVAEVITEDLRLIERFFMPIKKILKSKL